MNKQEYQSEIARLRATLGERAFRAAMAIKPTKKVAALAIARKYPRKGRTQHTTALDILALVRAYNGAAGIKKSAAPWRPGRFSGKPVLLPKGKPIDRLPAYRKMMDYRATAGLRRLLDRAINPAHQEQTAITRLPAGAPVAAVAASVVDWITWGDYSKRCKYQMHHFRTSASVPSDWAEAVEARGMADLHGLITLAALPLDTGRDGETAYRVRWARKTVGWKLIVEDGYVVRRGAEMTHGDTLAACRGQLTRRENEAKLDRIEADILARLESNNLNGSGAVLVHVADSLRAGNCEAGTLSFRDKYFSGRESATVRELCGVAESFADRRFVYAACLQAIRREKRAELVSAE